MAMEKEGTRGIDVWTRFLRAHKVLSQKLSADLMERQGLKIAWFDVLAQLKEAGGRLRMSELADRILFSTSGLTRLVDRMEKSGLVRREPCEDDRRGYWAILERPGHDVLSRAQRVHFRGIRHRFLDHLDGDELLAMDRALVRVLEAEEE